MPWTREKLEAECIGAPIEALGDRAPAALSAFDCVEKHLGAEWLAARHLHSYRHHVGPSNIPIAVEPQHCRQWFTQIAVGSSQQGAPGGFGSIARRPGIVRWYGAFPGISAPQPSAQRPAP